MSLTPPYSLLTRTSKGSQLTIEELDGNLLFLASTLSGSNTITGSVNFTGSLVDFLQVGTVTGSFSGDGSGLTGVTATATVPAGTVSSSLQFTGTDDVTFRNITASGDISSSGIITAGTGINIGNQASLLPFADTLGITDETGGELGLLYTKTTNFTIFGASAINGATLGVGGNITADSHITASGNISASGDIISTGTGSFNYVTTPTIEGSGSTALLHIEGQISASGTITAPSFTGAGTGTVVNITGDVSASGFVSASNIHATGNITAVSMSGDGTGLTGITATLPAGTVSSSLQFTNTDDVTFRNITASGDISIDNPGKLWLDGGSDTYIWASGNNHIGIVAFNNQTLTVDPNSIEVDGYITGSDFIQIAGTANHTGVKISASNSAGDTRDAQMIVPEHGFEIKNASNNNVLKIYDSQVGINVSAVSSGDYALQVSGSAGGTKAIEAIGDISASGNITAVSMSGDGSGLTGVSSAVPAGTVSSSLQFGNTDDVTFRNITASSNIKGVDLFLTGGDIDLQNDGAQSNIKFYCESSNAHYTKLQAAPHSEYSGNPTATLPAYDFDFAAPNFQGNVTASSNISSSGTVTALTGSFGTITGLSPITVTDSITFQQPITASIISASTFSGDGSGLTNVPESTDIDVYLNFEEARSYAYIVPYNLQFAGFTTSSAMTVQISSSGAPYVFTSSLSQFSTLSITSSAAGLITLSGSKL